MRAIHALVSIPALTVGVAVMPMVASAQPAPVAQGKTQPGAGQGGDTDQLQEIIVTAQKRSQNFQEVPISITAVTAGTAKAAGISGTTDISRITPGLTVTQTANAPLFFLRGVGTALGGTPGDEGSVNVVVDDVVYTSIPGTAFSLNNIDRIEVLRGPQGTLFGRNAAGGVISIITREPQQTPHADVSVSYGNYNTVAGSAYVTGGLARNLAADLAVQYSNQIDGYGTNLFNRSDVNKSRDVSVRSKLVFDDGTTYIRLAGDFTDIRGDLGVPRKILPGAVGLFGQVGTGGFQDVNLNDQPLSYLRAGGIALKVRQDLGWARVTSISAYRRTSDGFNFDQDGSPIPLVNADFIAKEGQFTEELQLASEPSSKIQWIGGFFYINSTAQEDPVTFSGLAFAPLGGTNSRFGEIDTQSYAGYGQVTVPLTNTTNITGGLRYTSDQRDFTYRSTTGNGIAAVPLFSTSATFDRLTWRAAIDQKLFDHTLIYASASSGFKAGSFNVINNLNPPIKPENLISYEAGVKSELFDRHLRLNVSGFYYDYQNIQVNQIVLAQTFFLNAPGQIDGIDVDFEARPLRGLKLSGGVEVLHSEYGDFPNAPFTYPLPASCGPNGPVAGAGPRTGGNITCPANAKGNQLVRAPNFTSTLTAAYTMPTSIGDFGVSVTYAHTSAYPWEIDGRLRQNPTDLVNGQISWLSAGGRLGARFWMKNLTDVRYYDQQSSSLNDTGAQAPPRTFGVTLEGHF